MRRSFVALFLGIFLAMLVAGGVALAEIQWTECPGGACTGTSDKDELIGTSVQDRIEAQGSRDVLYGLGDTDTLSGQLGGDVIHGDLLVAPPVGPPTFADPTDPDFPWKGDLGEGNWDALYGGQGPDTLYGEAGKDVLYAGTDTKHDELNGGSLDQPDDGVVDVYVVEKDAYETGLKKPTADNADVIKGETDLGTPVQLQQGESRKPQDLLARAEQGAEQGSHLFFYPPKAVEED